MEAMHSATSALNTRLKVCEAGKQLAETKLGITSRQK
jgi:hypothetical protein